MPSRMRSGGFLFPLPRQQFGQAVVPVAGDADQQTDPAAGFQDWRATMRALQVASYETVTLDVGYRCPPPVAAFARALRSANPVPAQSVALQRFSQPGALIDWLVAEVAQLEEQDPTASVCIIVRNREPARQIAAALRGRVPCKLVLDGEFAFHRGADVTTIEHVKGLEFDYVIVPDASAATYPVTPEARRALYVAATRARYQLALACTAEPSALIDPRACVTV